MTSQKRAEMATDVPLAINVFTHEEIQNAGLEDVGDVAALTPGLTFTPILGSQFGHPVMRGLSQTIGEPNVGFFLDGVYQSSRIAMDALLFDIERIEVVKGTQNALYGRNTFGGAINLITRAPARETTAQVTTTLGRDGLARFRGSLSGPILGEDYFFRLGYFKHHHDGFFTNQLTGGPLDEEDTDFVALSLKGFPTPGFDFRFRIGLEQTDNGDHPLQFVPNNFSVFDPTFAGFPPVPQLYRGPLPNPDDFAVTPGHFERDNLTTSLALNFHPGDFTVTSVTGFNAFESDELEDNDYTAREVRLLNKLVDQDEVSQELRIVSPGERPLRWLVGLYYYDLEIDTLNDDRFVGEALGFPGSLSSDVEETTESLALFGKLDYDLTDRLTLSLSGRYTDEKKAVSSIDRDPNADVPLGTFADEAAFDTLTPKLAAEYAFARNRYGYASLAKGSKTGGFNVITIAGAVLPEERTYDEEESLHFEVGYKTWLFDDRLNVNLAAYAIEWEDQIVRALGEQGALLNVNAAKTQSRGFEADFRARPASAFDVSGSVAYTDARYDSYVFTALAGLGLEPDLAGVPIEFYPEWTASLSLQYRMPAFGNADWRFRFDGSWRDDVPVVQTADAFIDDLVLGNLRVGLVGDRWEVTLWVEDIFDEDDPAGAAFIPDQGRQFDFLRGAAGLGPRTGLTAFNALTEARPPPTWGITGRLWF